MLTTIATFLFGGLKWLKDAISGLLQWVKENPWQAATFLFIALSVLFWRSIQNEKQRTADAWEAANAEKAAHVQTVINYRTAAKIAQEAAEAEKKRKEALYAKAAHESDQAYADLRARYRSVLQRAPGTHSSGADQADLSVSSGASGVSVEAASGAGVLVSRNDALICADNTAYAQAAFEWAEKVAATRGETQ